MSLGADIPSWWLRSQLDTSYENAKLRQTKLRDSLRSGEKIAVASISGGTISSTSGSGRSASFFGPGSGAITVQQIAAGWRYLVDLFDTTKSFLDSCGKYGLDPDSVRDDGWPSTLTVVDSGYSSTDESIYTWMKQLVIPVTESQSDYHWLRIPPGIQFA